MENKEESEKKIDSLFFIGTNSDRFLLHINMNYALSLVKKNENPWKDCNEYLIILFVNLIYFLVL